MQLHRHLSLSLKVLGLLVCVSDSTTLNLVLEFKIFLIDGTFLSKDFFDISVGHLLLVLEILDAGLGNRNIDFDQVSFLAGLHCFSLCFLGEVTVV